MRCILLAALAAIAFTGCTNPQNTVDEIRREIAAFKAAPTDDAPKKIEDGLARLEDQIAQLETKGKSTEARTYRSSLENLRADYHAARMVRAMKDTQSAINEIGSAFKQAGESIGEALKKDPTPIPTP